MFHLFKISLFILVLVSCSKEKPPADFEAKMRFYTDKICNKSVTCFRSMTRTFPQDLQSEVSMDSCKSVLMKDFNDKLKLHTETMKAMAPSCYEAILAADCDDMMAISFSNTSCILLKKESETIFAKARSGELK